MTRGVGGGRRSSGRCTVSLGAALAAAIVGAGAGTAAAQTPSDVDTERAAVETVVGLRVPVHLDVRVLGGPTITALSPEGVEIELLVEAASNTRWRLTVTVDSGDVEIWTPAGRWETACPEMGAPVVALGLPTNAQVTVVRLRVRGAAQALRAAQGGIVIAPAAGPAPGTAATQGAVSVSWRGSE